MNTGKQDRKITFVTYGPGISDGSGGTVPDRIELLTTFAEVNQVRSGYRLEQLQEILNDTLKFIVKFRSSFDPNLAKFINYNGVDLSITGIELNNQRHKRYWEITAINGNDSSDSGT